MYCCLMKCGYPSHPYGLYERFMGLTRVAYRIYFTLCTFTGTMCMDWSWTQCTLCSLGQRVSFFQSQSNFLWNALQILIFLLYIRFEPASFIGSLAKYQPHYFNLVPPLVSFQSLSLLLIICWLNPILKPNHCTNRWLFLHWTQQ